MGIKRRPGTQKNPPILSHEFFIQNHADIISCVAMVFVIGLLFQGTQQLASIFVVMGHNTTDLFAPTAAQAANWVTFYSYGVKDFALVFFYFLISIVIHAVIQEFVLDKINKKLHLSKVKNSKFNESGQLLAFYLISIVWAGEIIRREQLLPNISKLWVDYPHIEISYLTKFFFIVQISYWLHNLPELYFQKVRREEWTNRITYSLIYFALFTAAYTTNFTRICLVMTILHYFVEALFHFSRLFYFADKTEISDVSFSLWNVLFVATRFVTMVVIVLTFWFGLNKQPQAEEISFAEGNFNTPTLRMYALTIHSLLQAWMMWNFINFQLKRLREKNDQFQAAAAKKKQDELSESSSNETGTKKSPAIRRRK